MTCLISASHASPYYTRSSIQRSGLLPGRPAFGRPYGVYVFRDDEGLDHPCYARGAYRCRWSWSPDECLWDVGYFGEVVEDHYVENGWCLLDSPQLVTLVTCNIHDEF